MAAADGVSQGRRWEDVGRPTPSTFASSEPPGASGEIAVPLGSSAEVTLSSLAFLLRDLLFGAVDLPVSIGS